MLHRIKAILEFKNLSITHFADTVGVPRPIMSHILSGRNKPSLEVVQKILKAFPDLSVAWLVLGEGDLLKTPETPGTANRKDDVKAIPESGPEPIRAYGPDKENIQKPATPKSPSVPIPVKADKAEKVIILFADNTFREYEKRDE